MTDCCGYLRDAYTRDTFIQLVSLLHGSIALIGPHLDRQPEEAGEFLRDVLLASEPLALSSLSVTKGTT